MLLDKLRALSLPLLDGPYRFAVAELHRRGWVALPVEKGRHVEPEHAQRMAQAMRDFGTTQLFAVLTEPGIEPVSGYELPATEGGLLRFSAECAGLNAVVLPAQPDFALLFTSEDYTLFAGPRPLVKRLAGTGLSEGIAAFRDYAADPWWGGRLTALVARYEPIALVLRDVANSAIRQFAADYAQHWTWRVKPSGSEFESSTMGRGKGQIRYALSAASGQWPCGNLAS